MPIRNCPIFSFPGNNSTVILPIEIINPSTGQKFCTRGLIDTGASECAIPAQIGVILGYDISTGKSNSITTGHGTAMAFKHPVTIKISHPEKPGIKLIHSMDNVQIDFMPDLKVVLLGVNEFLSHFTLNINYPRRIFSIIK